MGLSYDSSWSTPRGLAAGALTHAFVPSQLSEKDSKLSGMPPCLSGNLPSDPALGSGVLYKLVTSMFGFRLGGP